MIPQIHSCPSCTALLSFQSKESNYIVCPQCKAGWQRHEDGALTAKSDIRLRTEDTSSPIRIGTTGKWKDKSFTVIGRIRCVLEDGICNNWAIHFEDGRLLTLEESYGQYAVCEKVYLEKEVKFATVNNLGYNTGEVELNNGQHYLLERRNRGESIEVEGEVWVFDWDGKFYSLEVASRDGDRMELLDAKSNYYLYFRVHYIPFDELALQQLRMQTPTQVGKTASCTQCHKPNKIVSFPWSQSWCCERCGAAHVFEGKNIKFLGRYKQEKLPVIPLYSKGVLKGREYELVGFAAKEDAHGWGWREYCFFNVYYGYAFLSEYDGHWIFLKEEAVAPVGGKEIAEAFTHKGYSYRLYNEYTFTIVAACGELPGSAFADKGAKCKEYIAPPYMWSRELVNGGLSWYKGEHISPNELYDAFGKDLTLPYQFGTGAVQLIKGVGDAHLLRKSLIYIVLGFLLSFFITNFFHRNQVVYENTVALPDTISTHTVVTPSFQLDKDRSNLELEMSAPVSNNWLETNVTLVNANTGKEYNLEQGVEYYSGYSDGESWSEGSNSTSGFLHSIPAGKYFMEITASKNFGSPVSSYTVKATYDVPMWRNFFIFLLLALLPGAGLYWYGYSKERARWQNSAFSPYE